ncbi:hypothetical protein VTI74DRAFT_10781 [Chaetomium olivicolor]
MHDILLQPLHVFIPHFSLQHETRPPRATAKAPDMAHRLVRLPAEILLRICELLSQVHKPSLGSFALANKHCYCIASALLFRTLTFNITTPSKLRAHTRKCVSFLRRSHAFHHVRCIVLVGFHNEGFNMHSMDDDGHSDDEADWYLGPVPSVNWDVNHQRLHGIPDYSDFASRVLADKTPVKAAYDRDTEWAPLAELIRHLPGLTDLIYECPTQFPPCLLRILHDKTSSRIIRLHLRTFKLRMLGGDAVAGTGAIDAHELALITSPCLHSVWLQDGMVPHEASNILFGRQIDTLGQMMKTEGLAPNLREVRVLRTPYRAAHDAYLRPRPYASGWLPGEFGEKSRKKQPIALGHLELGCHDRFHRITDVQIQHWAALADLSSLQTLELTAPVAESGLDVLSSLRFPALTALTFRCMDKPNTGYFDKVRRFIHGLSRLESLYIRGWDWSIASLADADGIGNRGAPAREPNTTLRTLWLDHRTQILGLYFTSSLVSDSEIVRLGALYPRVETLSVPIRRSKGDSDEVARYKALGTSFPRLKRLALTLDSSPPFVSGDRPFSPLCPESTAEAFEDQYIGPYGHTNRHFMDVMVNSALDKELAKQIFEAVASPSLETMMVRVQGGMDIKIPAHMLYMDRMPMPSVVLFLNGLAREWIVDTVNSNRDMRVKELGPNAEGWRGVSRVPSSVGPLDPFLKHFRRLWPETKKGSKGWFDDWESWPLASAGEA